MSNPPPNLKAVGSFLKLAKEYDKRDPTIAYFCRMYAVQKGIKIDSKTPDSKTFLFSLMDQLETAKKQMADGGDESVSNDIVAQAHLETKTINLFTWADTQDRGGVFNKNVTKAFYSASLLFEVLTQFGEQNDECKVMQRYSKWKATYLHKCLQTGETPLPGPQGSGFEDDLSGLGGLPGGSGGASGAGFDDLPSSSGAGGSGGDVGAGDSFGGAGSSTPGHFPDLPSVPPSNFSPPTQPQQPQQPQQPPVPQPRPQPQQPVPPPQPVSAGGLKESYEVDCQQVEKLCKFAISALQYEDVKTAAENLTKALAMLKR